MRVFESDRFKDKYIEGLSSGSSIYEYPDEGTRDALNYGGFETKASPFRAGMKSTRG